MPIHRTMFHVVVIYIVLQLTVVDSLSKSSRDPSVHELYPVRSTYHAHCGPPSCISFTQVCPNKFELLHPAYRKLCHLLADVDEWGQIAILSALQRYVRTQFTNPQREYSIDVSSNKPAQQPSKPATKVGRSRTVSMSHREGPEVA